MTEEERLKAVETAKSLKGSKYASALPQNEIVKDGQLDCSGLVRYSMMQNKVISDPFTDREGNGVSRIMQASRQVKLNDIREGDLVVMKTGSNENGHVGFATNIVRDEKGNVISYVLLHSEAAWTNSTTGQSGGGNVNEYKIVVGSEKHYSKSKYNHRFYQWDTPDPVTSNNKKETKDTDKNSGSGMSWSDIYNTIKGWLSVNPNIKVSN